MLLVKVAGHEGCCDARQRLTLDRRRRRSFRNQLFDRPRRVARRRRLELEKISIFIEPQNFSGMRSRARVYRVVARAHPVELIGKLVGVDGASAGFSGRNVVAYSEATDCLSVELEELVDVFAAIEVGPPCRLLFAAVIGHQVSEQVFRSQGGLHHAVLVVALRRQDAGQQRLLEVAAAFVFTHFLAMPDALGARRLKLGVTGRIGRLDSAKR